MRAFIAALVAFAALAVTGPAGAATWQVYLGEQGKPPAGTPKGATLNAIFPAALQIHAGDKVKFTSATFHTASYLGGTALGPPFMADPAKGTYSGINDSTGAAFYFNSLPKLVYNTAVFGPAGGTKVPGKGYVSTGILSPGPNGKPVSATLTFPKAGAFKLDLHGSPGHGDEHRGPGARLRPFRTRPPSRRSRRRRRRQPGRRHPHSPRPSRPRTRSSWATAPRRRCSQWCR